jgi:inosose dehydratase
MGTVVQSEAELDRLLTGVPGLRLVLDPGHLAFAGIDPHAVMNRHGARVAHVHLKSVRGAVAEQARREGWSFYRAVSAGVFTIPGDGAVDFPRLFAELSRHHYCGWLVVEAEEDPALAPPLAKACRAREYVRRHAGA